MSSSARLKYQIVKCSSEDPDYPVTELLAHSSQTKGWQTARFCDFPQEICLQFETPVHLRKVEFLSHQSKIATKIELFTALPPEGQECRMENVAFKRLGYLSLDNNERSEFQARELKSVYVDVSAQCLRILFHKCHVNRYNIVNQVGLIALNCLGEVLGPDLAVGQPAPNPALARGPPPAAPSRPPQAPSPVDNGQDSAQAASDEMRYDAKTLERIRALTVAKQRAVEAEDYEEAKRCKEMLARLRQTGILLRELEDRKRGAVQNEDYDAAKALKVEIERLRGSIERPQEPQPNSSRASPVDNGLPPDQGDPKAHDWHAQPPMQPTAPRGVHQPRMESTPRGFSGAEGRSSPAPPEPFGGGPGSGHQHQPPGGSPVGSPSGGGGGAFFGGMGGGRAGSPALPAHQAAAAGGGGPGPGPPAAFDFGGGPPPARESAASPPLPAAAAAAAGGARVAHSPVGGVPPWGPSSNAMAPPPEQPLEREPSSNFDPASHPLAGVPNVEDLSQPEPLGAAVEKEAEPLVALFGEYIARCLFSKAWTLRDAALQKVVLDLNAGAYDGTSPGQLVEGLASVLKRAIPDKNVQVFLSCGPLLQALMHRCSARSLRRPEVHQSLEPMMAFLADRLGDANARVDKTARDAHMDFARCPAVGAGFTASHVLRPPKKKTVPPRVFSSRLQLLAALVQEVGLQPDHPEGLALQPTVQIAMEWFNNSNAEVRESAVKLVGACYAHVGLDRIEPYLSKLKAVKREVFDAEFERISGEDASLPPEPTPMARGRGGGGGAYRDQTVLPGEGGGGGMWGDMPAPQVPPPRQGGGGTEMQDEVDDFDPTVCQFCLRQDPTFTPETVDVHYWRECPMLIQCNYCQQVVEIATLLDHLSEECESGPPARAQAQQMTPGLCPLCHAAVGNGEDEDWRDHLIRDGCPRNPRDANRHYCT